MKNCKTLPQNLFLKAVLLLFVSASLLTTPQDAPASVNKITITSNAGSDDTYKLGDKIEAAVEFNVEVNVESSEENADKKPQLTFRIGATDRNAVFDGRKSGNTLVFAYTVTAADVDTDGIEIPANSLTLNGGFITETVTGKPADLKHPALSVRVSHKVNGAGPTINTSNGIVISSSATSNNTYKVGDTIQATVTFNRDVDVTGTPQLTLKIGTANKNAGYSSGSGTAKLVFAYTVTAGDTDTDGIEIAADSLTFNSGTITDINSNIAILTHPALSAQASHKVDGTVPTITKDGIAITSTPTTNNTYKIGEKIQTGVRFSEDVNVTGTPQLTLKIGTADKTAAYTTGNGLRTLVFEYTVTENDTDTDGIEIEADSLTLNGGTIKDAAGNAATLTHTAVSEDSSHKVDAIKPSVDSIEFTSTTAPYIEGEVVQATVTFTENVTVTGTPRLPLQFRVSTMQAEYQSGSGTTALVFEYTVRPLEMAPAGILIAANALNLNGGTIKDAVGNAADLTHAEIPRSTAHTVDTLKPTVSSLEITSNAGSDNTYKTGDKIQITATFSENVILIGALRLLLEIGSARRAADYASGSGTTALVLEYTVAAGDTDADGIAIAANALNLNTPNIKDAGGNIAPLTHAAIPAQSSHTVDTTAPEIVSDGITITSTDAPYIADEVIQATVTFTENVTVTGTPQLTLQIGNATKTASYASGTGTTALVFEYTVAAGDTDADGISIAANAIALNSGTIEDAAGNAATLTHTAISAQSSHTVDTITPEIVSNGVTITSTTAHYKTGEVIQATATFTENVVVTGTPQLALQIGGATKAAGYTSGTGTTALVFEYTTVAGDTDADGISIAANALSLNSGTIKDAGGNAATLTHTAVPTDSAHQVDTTNPSINSIAFTSTTAPYTEGEVVQATVTFDEKVFVTGTPRLPLQFRVSTMQAEYQSGSGTTALVFEYTVRPLEMAPAGILIAANALNLNGGTIKDAVGNTADLTHAEIPRSTAHIVDTAKPRINALRITSTPTNNTYKTGDSIDLTVDWSKAVTVTGLPTIELSMEKEIRTLSYASGSNSNALVFSYTVTAGDTDETGIGIAAGQIALGTGVTIIQQGETTAAILNHPGLSDNASHKVDTTAPKIVSSNGIAITSTTAPYTADEVVQATVTFDENVVVTGTPQLTLQIGDATKDADYTSGTGTTALLFEYTVVAGDTDADGISIAANALALNSGTIQDAAGNAATLTHTALPAQDSHRVDGTVPTIATNGIAITSTPTSNSIYTKGDKIQATVTFSENVDVTGTPQLTLRIGTADKNATYTSGTGTTALVFEYTVAASDADADGIEIRADKLTLNGGTIKDAAGNAAMLTYNALPAQASHKVDGTIPAINGIAITSTPISNNTYKIGDKIQATVTFSENMVVTGTPQLALQIGAVTRTAGYTSGTGTAALVFEYTVVAGDTDANGISIDANALTLNGGTIKDTTGSPAVLTHTAVSDDSSHQVDSTVPTIAKNGIAITSTPTSNNIYTQDDVIQVTVTFSENVDVTGTPQLTLRIGTADKNAIYTSGTGTTTLVFEYTVVASDADADGIEIRADKLTLNGGTIKDAAGNAATLTYNALLAQASHKVDGIIPAINGIAITSTPTTNNTYKKDDKIQATVTFSENMVVTGTPQLALQISTATKTADYVSGSGSAALVFEYTIATGDTDTNGISIGADALTLNGGTIKDTTGSPAVLTHTALSDDSSHQVDSIKPTLSSIQITSSAGDDATYMLGNVIQISMTMSEVVNVTGTPKLTLTIGTQNRLADYQSGGGTATLEFAYAVVAGDMDTNGISIGTDALSLNGGTLQDAAGNAAVLTHSAVPDNSTHKVDTEPPKIVSSSPDDQGAVGAVGFARAFNAEVVSNGVEITSSGPYGTGDAVQIAVTFSERVNVTGTPEIQLQIGGTTKNAGYQSGSSTDEITFAYTIVSGDSDVDGISIPANSIQLNGGNITDIPGNPADLKHSEVSAELPHRVDTTLLKINSLAFSSTGPYKTSDNIEVTVATTKRVTVTGDVRLKVMIGNTEKSARYHSGSGANRLTFRYTVTTGDNDTNGVSVSLNSLSLNGGTIRDELGRDLDINHDELSDAGDSQRVDTISPQVRGIAFTSTGPYGVGNDIEITVTISEAVEVIGTPTLGITIGTTQRAARFFRGTGTDRLVFRYELTTADEDDADGVAVNDNSLALNGSTITDRVGNTLNLNHEGITDAGNTQIVRMTIPSIYSVAFSSTGPYGISDNIEVTLTTTKSIIVTGSATLKVMIGHTEKLARYHSGSGTNRLIFQYTVASGDGDDTNGVSVRANSLSLNGGTIADELGTALNLNHDALPDGGDAQRVDTTLPQVRSLAFTSTGPYSVGSDIQVTVITSEAVIVAGRPTLTIVIGSTERAAHFYNSSSPTAYFYNNSGTTILVFWYRITAADKDDTNGISVKANSLTLNGGTITDSVGNDLNLNHSGVANAGDAQIVGTTVSDIRSLAFTSTGPYAVNDIITVTAETTEKVTVTGIPRIPMTLGTATKYANYVSGSETTSLVFQYTVVTGDEDVDGVEIAQNALENYNGSKIKNSYRTDLNLNHLSVAADPKHRVDTSPPRIVDVDFSSDAQAVYTAGNKIEVVVTFEETGVEVKATTGTDMPSVTLLFGDNSAPDSRKTEVEAYYTESRPGSTKLVFTYTVTSDTPIDTDGIQIKSRSLKIPAGASIQDASGNAIRATQAADGSAMVNIRASTRTISRPILPAVTSTGIIFNEFLNADTNKEDWVELRNITDREISIGGWELSLSTGLSRGNAPFEFPEMTLRAGTVLLLVNTGHKETYLERSQAYTYHYLIVPELHLPASNFSLILRDRSKAIADVVGDYFGNAEGSDTPIAFNENQAYFREQPNTAGYEAAAWQESGYQGGLGYDRKTPKDLSLGTPGYLKRTLTQPSTTAPVSISEIMFTPGKSKRLPQWIELYNGSKTEVVTLQGWRLQVEGYDPNNTPTHTFSTLIIQSSFQILPNQTALIVTKDGRNSEHFPEQRIYNLSQQHPDKTQHLETDAQLIPESGFAVVLKNNNGDQVDIVGNLDGQSGTRDEPSWKLPNCITRDEVRTSIIRQYEDGMPLVGTRKSSWFRATSIRRTIITYWGHPKDVGNPGWKKGGALPVQLSSFSANRIEQGALIKWTTESELENAGFNVLRSDTKTGPFTVVNPRMLQGAGTTSERHTYQYVDTTAKAGHIYYYRLEEVSFAGVHQPLATCRLRGHVSAANRQLTTFGGLKKME